MRVSGSVRRLAVALLLATAGFAAPLGAQVQMPDPSQISGQPLPSADLPSGTISVRVIRGSFANNLVGQKVEINVDGTTQTLTTDANGRVQLSSLRVGAHVKAVAVVDGERLESQDITMGASGIRVVLAATDPEAAKRAAENKTLAAGPAVKGIVVLGPESRILMEMADDQLNVYYYMDVINSARTPVDIGGPLMIDLPADAQAAAIMDGSTKQATVSGSHVTVLGPFAPGTTPVQVAFELPYSGGTAHLVQKMPAELPEVIVIAGQLGGLDLVSKQISAKRNVVDQGERILAATGPGLQAGQTLTVDLTGLPHHALWPRYLALTLAGSILTAGIWAAVAVPRRRRTTA